MKISLLNNVSKRPYLSFVLLCLSLNSKAQHSKAPRVLRAEQITNTIAGIPSYTKFGASGIGFFGNSLYVSTNIGLLKIQNDSVFQLLSWYPKDDVISGPWIDQLCNRLWAMHDGKFSLLSYNGQSWQSFKVPETKPGYTRGDALQGVRMYTGQGHFYLQGGGSYWLWNEVKGTWLEQAVPAGLGITTYRINGKEIRAGWEAQLIGIVPTGKAVLCVMRFESLPFLTRSNNNFLSDRLYYFDREWKEIINRTGMNYLVESIVPYNDSVAYALTMDQRLLRVSLEGVDTLNSVGTCDAIQLTTKGKLIASFRKRGIFEYNGTSWTKKFSAPYLAESYERMWVYLAENEGRYVVAMTPFEKEQGRIWISVNSTLKEIRIR